ncbi:exopolysaccharide production repressor protein [Oryzifoliimicrobium ureilyticus]|uniref:exopolysaccharide production repressor protein n=1 Tax=Oryzifoliimicrobium ureilyticus TaxID=3113724 RepID=UPI0030766D8F
MYAPRVFISMFSALVVFAIASYVIGGSVVTTIIATVIATIVLQTGYFIGVLILVARQGSHTSSSAPRPASSPSQRLENQAPFRAPPYENR